jgi:hypothetical protein
MPFYITAYKEIHFEANIAEFSMISIGIRDRIVGCA